MSTVRSLHQNQTENARNTEIRSAAHRVALNWRDAIHGENNPDVVTDRLHRSLEHLLAVFERHAARHLEELTTSRDALEPEPPDCAHTVLRDGAETVYRCDLPLNHGGVHQQSGGPIWNNERELL